jgi:tRNA dimethylallyltransferase 2
MTLGTGKDLEEYGEVPYHLIDIEDAGTKYNLYGYLRDAAAALDRIESHGAVPVLCGGTGMYVEAFLRGTALPEVPENASLRARLEGKSLDELTEMLASMKTLHNVTDVDTPKRAIRAIEIQTYYQEHPDEACAVEGSHPRRAVVVGIDVPRDVRRERITRRLEARLDAGMVQEVERLLASGIDAEALMYYGLEYKYLTMHVLGQLSYDEMFRQLETAIHQFAKRQMTWFRGMERRGTKIHWLPYDMDRDEFVAAVVELWNFKKSEP